MKYIIEESQHYQDIQSRMGINSLLAKVIDMHKFDDETLKSFLNPKLTYHDFSLFLEADMALDRIHEAIENHEKICIYGDYDCDGILATTILVQAFLEMGIKVGYHIPNRFDDGYGLNSSRVKQMASRGYTLIITVDNGIKAFEAIDCANELGIDVIVTDHHQYDQELPEACCFIHTKLSPDYPFKEISGGFIAYKLASALLERHDKYLYCLAAITTVSDMMPLLDENRSLLKRALMFMSEEKYPSLELLLGDVKNYTSSSIGFTIAPKINSFGRLPELCNPNILVKYFLKDASYELLMKVSQLAKTVNAKRQQMTNEQYALASEKINDQFLYWASEDVHEGLIGLIAGKYTREYEKPSFVMHYNRDLGIYKGSARSVQGFSLHRFFTEHQEQFVTFGGHAMAGGFCVDEEHYESFYHCIEESLKNVELEATTSVLLIDESDLSIENIESLSLLEPFGMCNEEPLYLLKNLKIARMSLLSDGKHIRIDCELKNVKLSALLFHQGHCYESIKNRENIDLIGTLNINEFRNQKNINLIVKDIM